MSNECSVTAFQTVGVTAEVTITPFVECGPLSVTCLPGRVVPADECREHKGKHRRHSTCKVMVFQELVVSIPITFGAEAACELTGVACGPASLDESHSGDDCTGSSTGDSSSSSSSTSSSSHGECDHSGSEAES